MSPILDTTTTESTKIYLRKLISMSSFLHNTLACQMSVVLKWRLKSSFKTPGKYFLPSFWPVRMFTDAIGSKFQALLLSKFGDHQKTSSSTSLCFVYFESRRDRSINKNGVRFSILGLFANFLFEICNLLARSAKIY